MAFAVADRVKETTTTTGTGTVNLGGALDTFQTFVAGVGGGNTTYYSIFHQTANEWEVGIGTVTDAATDTLSRDTIISSSNGGSAVNFSAGTKDVICTLPSSKSYILDNAGDTTISADLSVTSISGSGAGLTGLNASNLASGTLPDARFPATLPTSSGANLTNLNASNVSSGTLDNARLSAIPNSALENSAITLNGTGVSLGGSLNLGDIEGVTAGNGLTGGGTTGTVTLNVGAGNLIDVTADAVDVDLSELTTSTSDADGDFFVVVDSVNAQKKLTKGNINISGFNNDAGYTTNVGDITGVTAGTNLTGGGTSGTVTLNMATGGVGAGTYGSTANSTKIDTITVDAYGRVTAVATGATGDIDGVTAGNGLTGGGTSGTPTLNVGAGTGIDVAADAISVDVSDFMTNGSNNRVLTATGTDAMNAEANMTFDGSTLDVSGTILTDKAYIALATLTDGATINWNMSTQSVAKVTLAGNRTMAAPTNGSTGQFASITVIQDGTGTRTLTWNAVFEFKDDTAPTLTSTGGKGDLFVFQYNGSKWLEVGRNLNLTQS